jgi:hypothetical protein
VRQPAEFVAADAITARAVGAEPKLRRQIGRGEISEPELRYSEITDVIATGECKPHIGSKRDVDLATSGHFGGTAVMMKHV